MLERIKGVTDRSWKWFSARAHGKHAKAWLVFLSLVEPIFSPIVPETLMVAILLSGSSRWKYYAWITSLSSVAGGALGYIVGYLLFSSVGSHLIALYGLSTTFEEAKRLLGGAIFFTMFLVSFSPLPDKVFVLASGFLGVSFPQFFAGYVIGRTLRFYLVAYLVHRFGASFMNIISKYFTPIALFSALTIAALVLWEVFR